jgi:hypothetical protein
MAHRSQRVDLSPQSVVWLGWGPQEEVSVSEPEDHHAGRKWHRTAREGHPDNGAVDHPEVLAYRLEGVYGLVKLHDQSIPALLTRYAPECVEVEFSEVGCLEPELLRSESLSEAFPGALDELRRTYDLLDLGLGAVAPYVVFS